MRPLPLAEFPVEEKNSISSVSLARYSPEEIHLLRCQVLIALMAMCLLTLLVFNYEFTEPWWRRAIGPVLCKNIFGDVPVAKAIYHNGQKIGVFHVEPSLQKNYVVTLLVEEEEEALDGNRTIVNVTFHAVVKPSVTVTSTTQSTSPLTTSQPVPSSMSAHICPYYLGRLGNLMFIFASSYGVAAQKNMGLVLPRNSILRTLFTTNASDVVNVTEDESHCNGSLVRVGSGACCKYRQEVLKEITGTRNVKLGGHLQSYRYFEAVDDAIRQAFSLTEEYTVRAKQAIVKALTSRYNSSEEWEGRTFVGVHVRRGDFASKDKINFGHMAAPADYFQRGMAYFDDIFDNVTFVICSDSPDWARANVHHNHSVVAQGGSQFVDFAILLQMNHTLLSTGSFGWWAGWLVNGTTVYYKDFFRKGSALANEFNPNGKDHIPPQWVGL